MDVAVIGAGYVGTVTAACLASRGHRVWLLERDRIRHQALANGSVPFHEPGLSELFGEVLANGALRIEADQRSALNDRDALLVCVGTPLSPTGEADMSQVESACRAIAQHASGATVVIRSTMPLGTSRSLAGWLARDSLEHVATNPEFLRQGSAIGDFLQPTRIVIGTQGGMRSPAALTVEEMYAGIEAPIVVTDFASAEMIKNAANGYLAMKLTFINEIADLCEAYGADVERVVEGIGLDPRIGPSYLRPGIGFGGSCLPKELANLVRLGRQQGLGMRVFDAAARSNDERAARIVDRLQRTVGTLNGRDIALLGLAFKAGTDDTRYSPAIALALELIGRGARVQAHDPRVTFEATKGFDGLARVRVPSDAIDGADLVVLATDWPEYRTLDWVGLSGRVRSATIFDGRNALDRDALEAAGWRVIRVGTAGRGDLEHPSQSIAINLPGKRS